MCITPIARLHILRSFDDDFEIEYADRVGSCVSRMHYHINDSDDSGSYSPCDTNYLLPIRYTATGYSDAEHGIAAGSTRTVGSISVHERPK